MTVEGGLDTSFNLVASGAGDLVGDEVGFGILVGLAASFLLDFDKDCISESPSNLVVPGSHFLCLDEGS